MRLHFLLCLGLATFCQAIPDVVKDWHKPLTGIPFTHTRSLAPRFHRRQEGRRTHSHIYVATEKNTIAALQPTYGTIVWRHVYDDVDRLVNFRARGPFLVTLSGPGGANLRVLAATSGHVLWELSLHDSSIGKLSEPADVGTDISYINTVEDVTVLSNSNTVRRISLLNGSTQWAWTASDDVSLNLHSRILQDEKNTYVIGLSKSFASYTIHITVLDSSSGKEVVSYPVPGNLPHGIEDLLVLEHPSEPSLLWTENGVIKWLSLANRQVSTLKGKKFASLVDLGIGEHGMFVALEADENAIVYRFYATDTGFEPRQLFTFPDSVRSDQQSSSIYTGGIDKDANPYVSRAFYSFAARTAALSLYVPHGANGTGLVTGIPLAHNTMTQGVIKHVALDVAPVGDDKYLTRAMLTNTLGAMQLWKGYELQWTREESLSDLQALQFVDLPERGLLEESGAGARIEAFVQKALLLAESIVDMSKLAKTAINDQLVQFISGRKPTRTEEPVAPSAEVSSGADKDAPATLSRDTFGFRKIIVAVSSTGKIYGIDSANGAILWNRILGLDLGRIVQNPTLHVMRSVLDGAIAPVIAVIANREDGRGTAVLHLDAMTGKVQPSGAVPPYFASNVMSSALPLTGSNRSVVLISNDNKIAVYPHASSTSVSAQPSNVYFTKISGTPVQNQLSGFSAELTTQPSSAAVEGKPAWSLALGPEEAIQYTFKPPKDSIASLGKVLADRKTLYKYLNPHILGVVTRSQTGDSQSIYLLDGVTGVVLYHTSVRAGGKLLAAMTENWLVFAYETYGSDLASEQTKGQHIVSVELYEGFARNDKIKSSEISSHSPEMERLTAYQHSFLLPYSISALSMTSTKYGISTKDVIVSTTRGQVQSIPRRLLDPRRHQDKASAADGEELLVPYDPLIADDYRRVLSKGFEVLGTKNIITSPALLESTSLVLTHGQDIFFTKVAPSGTFDLLSESFNKLQLVLTIIGLSVAIMVTRPIVQRRQLKQQWYS